MIRALWREPLCQFLLLGGLIFAAHAWLQPTAEKGDGLYRIHVSQQQLDALRAAFIAERGRPPDNNELHIRLQQWLDEQMLYRQALALGLDERDAIVRRQMVQKMRFLLADSQPVPEPSTEQLQAWLQEHPQRYGHSPRLSFEQVYLSRAVHGTELARHAQQLLEQLHEGAQDFAQLGDPFPAGRQFTDVDQAMLRREFGRDFFRQIESLPDNRWSGPVASGLGLHLLRVTARKGFVPAQLAEVREQVEQDWRLHWRERKNAAAMQQLRQRFDVIYSPPADAESG